MCWNVGKNLCWRSAGIFPLSQEGFERLDGAIEALTLNDASVSVQRETSAALGPGFRCGFLGMLHMDVFMQRLEQEHGEEVRALGMACRCAGVAMLCVRRLRAAWISIATGSPGK